MSYTANKGSMIAKPAMMRAAHWPKFGTSPIATLHDPRNGSQYFMGYNHPADIPGCKLLVDFEEKSTILYNKAKESDGNWTGTSIDTSLYKDGIFGASYDPVFGADYFTAPNVSTLNVGTFTIEAVCRFNDISSSANNRIISKTEGAGWTIGVGIDGIQGGVSFYYHDGAYQKLWIDEEHLDTVNWFHVAATVEENGVASIYLNGKLMDSMNVGTYTACNYVAIILAECGGPLTRTFDGDCATIRFCDRVLKPYEFMNHWHFNSMIDGEIVSGGAVLFDPAVSAFEPDTVFTVQADWDSTQDLQQSNIIVNNIRGIPDEDFAPSPVDFTELHVGKVPMVDDATIGMWILDGRLNQDGKVPDLSGFENHMSLVGLTAADVVNSRDFAGYEFNGTTDYLECATADFGIGMTKGTFECLVRLPNHTGFKYIFSSGDEASSTRQISFSIQTGTGYPYIYQRNDDTADYVYAAKNLADGALHHFAIVSTGSAYVFYIDGVLYSGVVSGGANNGDWFADTANRDNITIGVNKRNTDSSFFEGFIPWIRISSVERTQDEIIRSAEVFSRLDGRIQDLFLPS